MEEVADQVVRSVDYLAHWAAQVRWPDIPEDVARRAIMVIFDDLASMVASRDEPEVARVHTQLLAAGSERTATLFRGGRSRTDPISAAIGNAIAASWSELDEGYRKVACHAGLYAVPALIAEAEASNRTVAEVLRALLVAYELTTRFARGWSFPSLTLHPHALFGAVGAAVAVGVLRGLDANTLREALTAATTLVSVGPYNHAVEGALVRNVWAAVGAFSGMQSVRWAEVGIGGLSRAPYDVFSQALGGQVDPKRLVVGLGEEWGIRDGYHKLYSCCQYAHSAVEAALDIVAALSSEDRCQKVKRIVVETHRLGLSLDNYHPRTTLAARFSMPHIVATVLALGNAGPDAFAGHNLQRPEITGVRSKVELRLFTPDLPWPHDRPARVTVELEDGREIQRECLSARGGPDRPLTEEDLLQKIRRLTADVYPNLAGVVEELLALRSAELKQGWAQVVERLTEGVSP